MNKRILVAPLNWGLGHATRCIPIINALLQYGFELVIGSDGFALQLLKKEFPNLEFVELPSYNIIYSKKNYLFKLKLLLDVPKVLKTIHAERQFIETIADTHKIDGIISDNRFGVFSERVPSVFVTHQLRVLSGNTTWLSTKINLKFIKKFTECWIPDRGGLQNLSGGLGHNIESVISTKYIGVLSRFKKLNCDILYDVLVLLSGPEPQRSILENILIEEFKRFNGHVIFVKGVIEDEQKVIKNDNITFYNFMETTMLQKTINESKLVVARSGYTTIMDLTKLGKNAFFIPTPGQFEQEYLAQYLTENGIIASCKQNEFTVEKLNGVNKFKGFKGYDDVIDFESLFRVFRG